MTKNSSSPLRGQTPPITLPIVRYEKSMGTCRGTSFPALDVSDSEGDFPDHTWPSWPSSPYSLGRQNELVVSEQEQCI